MQGCQDNVAVKMFFEAGIDSVKDPNAIVVELTVTNYVLIYDVECVSLKVMVYPTQRLIAD